MHTNGSVDVKMWTKQGKLQIQRHVTNLLFLRVCVSHFGFSFFICEMGASILANTGTGSQFEHPCGFGGNNRIFPGPGSPATALLSMDSMMETGACKDCVLPLSDVPRI